MIGDYEEIRSLFMELDDAIDESVSVYMIGGGALMRYGIRNKTN